MGMFSRYPTTFTTELNRSSYDYIVVGGGTAGCVLASRLSEDPQRTVLLLERGPVVNSWFSRVPLITSNFQDQRAPVYKWQSVPMKGISGKTLSLAAGKALGGTAKVNGLIYSRSAPGEYNAWRDAGRKNWSWEDVEPFFRKSEHSLSHGQANGRSIEGPWANRTTRGAQFELSQKNIDAAAKFNIPCVTMANDSSSPSVACTPQDATIDSSGHRCSTEEAFLPKSLVSNRKNLTICTNAIVTSLDIRQAEDGNLRAFGVRFGSDFKADHTCSASATREVILCAGAIVSPQLLLLSGIGPRDHLQQHEIPVLKELAGVGQHLQDHISVPLLYKVPLKDTVEGVLMGSPLRAAFEFLKYAIFGKGLLSQQVQQYNITLPSTLLDENSHIPTKVSKTLLDARDPQNIPDIEVMFLPVNPTSRAFEGLATSFGIFSYMCTVLRPQSYGSIRLSSSNPRDRPLCDLGMFNDSADRPPLRKALKLALALAQEVRKTGYPLENLSVPEDTTDETLDEFSDDNVMSTFHYSSSCRMDTEKNMGVVDDELRVYGVNGLRIADASVFPQVPACHIQAPVVMVAERCAEFIRAGSK
ncbi:GMC oxidoreductase [Lentinula aciculospora]|uniref:GMC oxidoreductase n=1 Tax=Lentinula aciculospora TaxID=153920 RepID=A0A9W9A2L1_9AGAR|nr:GMC oxidoreductase [Lentinula aciculospora]